MHVGFGLQGASTSMVTFCTPWKRKYLRNKKGIGTSRSWNPFLFGLDCPVSIKSTQSTEIASQSNQLFVN